jgi:putative ATP-dependent endonuclease of OLD family
MAYLEWNWENAQPTLKIFFEATKNQERIISTDIKAGSTNEGTILTSEARDFLKVTYLKPLRDAKNELIPKKLKVSSNFSRTRSL